MEKIRFTNIGRKISAAQMKTLEEQLGCKLPKDYRDFLLKHNGGRPSKSYFFAEEEDAPKDPSWVVHFYFVDEHLAEPNEKAHAFSISFHQHEFGKFIPDDCLNIGTVVRDDFLLLRIRGKRRGQIDIKIMDELELGEPFDWERNKKIGIYPVAQSFSDFLNLLIPDEDIDY